MVEFTTEFGSIDSYRKGGVQVIDDDPKNYVFSNIFEVAATSSPWERVVVGKNFEYVIEVTRAEGISPWFTCAHDEFALSMDGEVEVHLIKLDNPAHYVDPESEGAHLITDNLPEGRKMGRLVLGRGHMGILPVGSAYRFTSKRPCALLIQSILGPVSVQKWAEICQH